MQIILMLIDFNELFSLWNSPWITPSVVISIELSRWFNIIEFASNLRLAWQRDNHSVFHYGCNDDARLRLWEVTGKWKVVLSSHCQCRGRFFVSRRFLPVWILGRAAWAFHLSNFNKIIQHELWSWDKK